MGNITSRRTSGPNPLEEGTVGFRPVFQNQRLWTQQSSFWETVLKQWHPAWDMSAFHSYAMHFAHSLHPCFLFFFFSWTIPLNFKWSKLLFTLFKYSCEKTLFGKRWIFTSKQNKSELRATNLEATIQGSHSEGQFHCVSWKSQEARSLYLAVLMLVSDYRGLQRRRCGDSLLCRWKLPTVHSQHCVKKQREVWGFFVLSAFPMLPATICGEVVVNSSWHGHHSPLRIRTRYSPGKMTK